MSSDRLASVLEKVLDIGNLLNEGGVSLQGERQRGGTQLEFGLPGATTFRDPDMLEFGVLLLCKQILEEPLSTYFGVHSCLVGYSRGGSFLLLRWPLHESQSDFGLPLLCGTESGARR